MTISKRLFDLLLALMLSVVLLPLVAITALAILILDGRPVFYISERMKDHQTGFSLVKFRTMKTVAQDHGVSGGNKADRKTRTGPMLRRFRLDEVPQLWNIFKGDMSFVGPRPPLREYVDRFPDLYKEVLRNRPGVTGLATVVFHRHEEMLLAPCTTSKETDDVYARRCVPRKAQLDLIYQEKRSLCLDILLVAKTVLRKLPLHHRTT